MLELLHQGQTNSSIAWKIETHNHYTPITYYWAVPLILDHSYIVEKLTNSKIADTKASVF